MIRGIGSDIIEVDRIQAAMNRHGERFLQRIFSPEEIRYCFSHQDAARHFAGRFAAKEAIVKALGTGFRQGVTWLDMEVLNDSLGKPEVVLTLRLLELCGQTSVMVTISHCKQYATATAIWVESSYP